MQAAKKGFSTDTEDKYEYRHTRKVITRTRLRIARRSSGQWGKECLLCSFISAHNKQRTNTQTKKNE